ncbi:Trypanosomal VSG domain containing protein, putative [Trypanosoma equiperdum]|uniref:Trypanosomal VSG domain containing protein, putative n=1 Tax=Trypanosoma equiperdum TaxID=5694 RepID=A0A1G4I5Q6_TRYEQ|nr:Trypanosomal VSG domain containing protein, putative [Trypanosoma equiperdum]
MLCICGVALGSSSAECFTGGVAINWAADATQVLPQVQAKCPKRAAPPLTAANVDTAITSFGTRVRHVPDGTDTHHFLGKQNTGTCSGVTGQLCVVYDTFYAGNTTEGHLAIPWIGQLSTAAAKLRDHEAAVADIKDATVALKQLQAMAWTIYSIPDTAEAPAHKVTPKEQLQKTQRTRDQHKETKTKCKNTGKCK